MIKSLGTTKRFIVMYAMALGFSAYMGIRLREPLLIHIPAVMTIVEASRLTYGRLVVRPKMNRLLGVKDSVLVQNDQLSTLLSQVNNELFTCESKRDEYHKLSERQYDELKVHKRYIKQLKDRLQAVTAERNNYVDSCDALQAELHEARVKVGSLEHSIHRVEYPLQSQISSLKDVISEYESLIDEKDRELLHLTEMLGQLNGKVQLYQEMIEKPKRLPPGLDVNNLANDISDYFMNHLGIRLDAVDARVDGSDWVLRYKTENYTDPTVIRGFDTQLRIDFKLPARPGIKVRDDEVIITIKRGEEKRYYKGIRHDIDWLEEAFIVYENGFYRPHHMRVTGATGSGKSELINNVCGVWQNSVSNLTIHLVDPYSTSTNWYREPDAVGLEESVEHLRTVHEIMLQREQDRRKGKYPTTIHMLIVDEFDRFCTVPGVLALVKDIWRTGRHNLVFCCVVGQTSLVGEQRADKVRLTTQDIEQTIGVYIRNTIEAGLTDLQVRPDLAADLREAWLTNAEKRVALIRPATAEKVPFVALLPEPGAYHAR